METRICKYCGKPLKRRDTSPRRESPRDFRRRSFCDKHCSSKFQHQGSVEARAVVAASKEIKTGTEDNQKLAADILNEAANNEVLDWTTRINAAKALLPYQNNKADKGSKKGDREEAAKKAAAGRFSAGAAPKVVSIKKQGIN